MLSSTHLKNIGCCRAHSTETALLRVASDILMQNDAGECSILHMLDVFDTAGHVILLYRIKNRV